MGRRAPGRAVATDSHPDAIGLERFEAIWTRMIELFDAHRPLWTASFEMLAQLDHAPEVRKAVADASERASAWPRCSTTSTPPSTSGWHGWWARSTWHCCPG